jgi:protein phosphatase
LIAAFGLSDTGPFRKNNEDSFFTDPALQLLVVADGMGAHSAGEVASKLAVETISGFIQRTHEDEEFSWPYGIEPGLSFTGNRLRTAVHLANRRVFRAAERHDEYTGMGTTVVCGLISAGRLAVAHAGDSRLYLFAEGALTQLTRDDTWAATVLAAQFDANPKAHPPQSMRHVLTNVIGARDHADVHISEHDLSGGESILLCSDGLHGVLDDPTIQAILSAGGLPTDIVTRLVEAALSRDVKDNVTAVLAQYSGD